MSDNISLEPLLNDGITEEDGLKRNVRVTNVRVNLEGYNINNIDDSSPAYYGFEDMDGSWIIMKESLSGTVSTFTYATGSSGYSTAWTNRAAQSYSASSSAF